MEEEETRSRVGERWFGPRQRRGVRKNEKEWVRSRKERQDEGRRERSWKGPRKGVRKRESDEKTEEKGVRVEG